MSESETTHYEPKPGSIACGEADPWAATNTGRGRVDCTACLMTIHQEEFDAVVRTSVHPDDVAMLRTLMRAKRLWTDTAEGVEFAREYAAEQEVARRQCTHAHGLTNHPFEHDPTAVAEAKRGNDGIDPWERCERTRDDEIHRRPVAETPRPLPCTFSSYTENSVSRSHAYRHDATSVAAVIATYGGTDPYVRCGALPDDQRHQISRSGDTYSATPAAPPVTHYGVGGALLPSCYTPLHIGLTMSLDLGKVDCLACLRTLARRAVGESDR